MTNRLMIALAVGIGAAAGYLLSDLAIWSRAERRTLTDDDMRKLARDA